MRAYGTHEVFFKKASGGRRVVDVVSEKVAGEFLKKLANPQPGLLESVGLNLGLWMAKEAVFQVGGGLGLKPVAAPLPAAKNFNLRGKAPGAAAGPQTVAIPAMGAPVSMAAPRSGTQALQATPPNSAPVSSGSISGIRPSTQASPQQTQKRVPPPPGPGEDHLDIFQRTGAMPAVKPAGTLGMPAQGGGPAATSAKTQVSATAPPAQAPMVKKPGTVAAMPPQAPAPGQTMSGPLSQGPGATPGRMKTDMAGPLSAPGTLGPKTIPNPAGQQGGSRAKQISPEEYAAKAREYAAGGGREGKNGTTSAPPGQLTGPQPAATSGKLTGPQPQAAPGHLTGPQPQVTGPQPQAKAPTGPQAAAAPAAGQPTGPQPQAKAPSVTGAQPAAAAPATGEQPAASAATPPGTPPAAGEPADASGKKKPFFGWKSKALGLGALAAGAYGIKRTFDVAEGLAQSGAANSQYGATPGGYYPPQYATN